MRGAAPSAALRTRPAPTGHEPGPGRSATIALAVPELGSAYFAELADHVVHAASDRGWTVLVDSTGGDTDRERAALTGSGRRPVDGLVLSPLALTTSDLAGRPPAVPLVLLGERIGGDDGPVPADHVVVDNTAAARLATAHLAGQGRRRIAALGAQRGAVGISARQRLDGYRQALAEAGLPLEPSLVQPVRHWHRVDGARAVRRLLDGPRPPDALFCCNDLLALGALAALRRDGVRVPDDVMVVGVDDIEESRFSCPSLTSIAPDKAAIGAAVIDLLARRLAGHADLPPQRIEVGYSLQVRESTGGQAPRL